MASHRDTQVLRHMQSVSEAFARKLAAYAPSPAPLDKQVACDLFLSDLQLPPPEPVAKQLIASGIEDNLACRISLAFVQSALRLRDSCVAGFNNRRTLLQSRAHYYQTPKAAHRVPLAYRSLYTRTLQEWTSRLLTDIVPRILRARVYILRTTGSKVASGRQIKKPFNQSALPVLEQFFDTNAFPSRLEKCELALRSNMDYRQIHVWFQNRRSRSRKEGRQLCRAKHDEALKDLENTVVEALLPSEDENGGELEVLDFSQLSKLLFIMPAVAKTAFEGERSSCAFRLDAPPHAFPAPYPPICSYEPFPALSGSCKLTTKWPRTCNPQRSGASISIDVDGLVAAFKRLSVEDATDTACKPSASGSCLPSGYPPIGFTTLCARAPHPSYIHPPKALPSQTTNTSSARLPTPRPSTGRDEKGKSCRRVKEHVAYSSPPSTIHRPASKRTLPRRIPRNPPTQRTVLHAACTRTHQDDVPSVRSHNTSRASSSYSSTSESEVDSPLSTPPLLPVDVAPLSFDAVPEWDSLFTDSHPCSISSPAFDYPSLGVGESFDLLIRERHTCLP